MSPPRASKNFQQRQPITTTLRNICASYPTDTCLRELLQNADDAGATEIEYVLDTKSYTDGPLLHPELRDYHGPAILARNNSVFTDKDFSSLSSVGDSGKREDPASTGKFGQGFNSVYHWTDGPWIYSRNWLLILDPHQRWSSETDKPGGPAWDVVENRDSVEIQNGLKTLGAFNLECGHEYDGTIIRIPLRTEGQSIISRIVNKAISTEKMREALEDFDKEIRDGALLFLKHVRRVTIRVDGTTISMTQILENNTQHTRVRKELPTDFRKLYDPTVSNDAKDVSRIFELDIKYENQTLSKIDSYLMQHTMTSSCGDRELDIWAREQKLFPWVAIAAPLVQFAGKGSFSGGLFSTLRLPPNTGQPVHIHGLFAIPPDRGNLDRKAEAVQWNQLLFENRVAAAWSQLLLYRNCISWNAEGFGLWPRADLSDTSLWAKLDAWVIDIVLKENLPVWNAISGCCVELTQGLFTKNDAESAEYIPALAQIQLPAVILEEALLNKLEKAVACQAKELNRMTPSAVSEFLREQCPSDLPEDISSSLLEYCLLDAIKSDLKGTPRTYLYENLHDLQLWPTMDGKLSVSGDLLLPRDRAEMRLFSGSNTMTFKTVDLDGLTAKIQDLLLKDITHLRGITRFRSLLDLAIDWPDMYAVASESEHLGGLSQRSDELNPLLRDIWVWICRRFKEEKGKIPTSLYDLWLIPINNGRIRRFGPGKYSCPTLILEKREPMADIILASATRDAILTPPLLDSISLTADSVKFLRKSANTVPELRFACQDQLDTFLEWLVVGREMLAATSTESIKALLKHLEKLLRDQSHTKASSSELGSQMRKLPLFSKTVPAAPSEERTIMRCDLDQGGKMYEAPPQLPSVPEIVGIHFYTIDVNVAEKYIVRKLHLLEKISMEQALTEHFLPWMATAQEYSSIPAKEALVKWIFDNSKSPSVSWITNVISQPIVPLPTRGGERHYRCLVDLVDPTSTFSKLYFDDEWVFPCADFLKLHGVALMACRLSKGVTSTTPLDRARYYSSCGGTLLELQEKVQLLLKVTVQFGFTSSAASINEIRSLKWIPGKSIDGQLALLAPNTCRGFDQGQLVDMVWGTANYSVKTDWRRVLGWDQPVPKDVLFEQLDRCLEGREHEKVKNILANIKVEDLADLGSKPCILGCHRSYMAPNRVFMTGSVLKMYSLAPFLDEVDDDFAREHANLLTALDIRPHPSIEDLQYVQNGLDVSNGGQLSENDLSMAITTLEVATRLKYPSFNFLIPDRTSTMRALPEIVHGYPNINCGIANLNFTHTRISEDLITRLEVEDSFAYATRRDIKLEDEEDDEFTPREKLSTVIADTLGRYPIDTTFNEFLANADDAEATKISWTIDKCDEGLHSSQSLLTRELAAFQGPALFAYNDGIFSDKDYAGFKDIGQGGKVEDATTTGMFGRGALSMYHFTDVPMLISGGFYVVLDPQQECLTRDRRWNRKVGIKIALSTARRVAEDQLTPFYGLHGFDKSCDFYRGTLFRFPFRATWKQTLLTDSLLHMDSLTTESLLEGYFDTARVSLLFLHNVTNIEFRIRGEESPAWSISAQRPEDSADDVFQKVTVRSLRRHYEPMIDIWRVGVTEIDHSPLGIARVGKGFSKITERGIAACLQQGDLVFSEDSKTTVHEIALADNGKVKSTKFGPNIFCRLPMASGSQLPVSVHASFAITGDRKTVTFEDRSDSAVWNHWLLTECIPEFYLDFLKDLSPRLGHEAFRFWPSKLCAGRLPSMSVTVANAFWTKVMDQEHVPIQFYPARDHGDLALVIRANDLRRTTPRKARKLHVVTSLSNARFDFLPESTSSKLRPLFETLNVDLVRPPRRIWDALRDSAPGLHLIDLGPAYLTELFKQESNCAILETFVDQLGNDIDKSEAMALLLEVLVPFNTGMDTIQINIVHGCRVLPRPSFSAPFGMLRPAPQTKSQFHLVATREEQKLFAFASDYLVNTTLFPRSIVKSEDSDILRRSRNPVTELMEADFNIRKFTIGDIGPLLAHSQSPMVLAGVGQDRDKWVPKLWTCINDRFCALKSGADRNPIELVTLENLLSKADLWDQAIYRYRANHQWCYITPRQFAAEPCVVDPESDEDKALCALIPDLRCLDRTCVPELLLEDEGQLNAIVAFQRFLRCLKTIEQSTGIALKSSLNTVLTVEAKETLRGLVIRFLEKCLQSSVVCDKAVLQRLPVWPRLKRPEHSGLPQYIAADDALFCTHSTMFMPWVKNLKNFVDPEIVKSVQYSLSTLGCQTMTAEQFWKYMKGDVPPIITSEAPRQQYFRLVRDLAAHGIKPSGNVALNGRGVMCKVESLYDYEDAIFEAAFRGEDSARFLHKDMRPLRSFWILAGLRTRPATGVMSSEDYFQCAMAMDRRWTPNTWDQIFAQDAETVSAYLSFDRPDFRTWLQSTWDQISKVRMFHVDENVSHQRPYRQARMQMMAREHTHCALEAASRTTYTRIVWSQVKFLKNPAATAVFEKLPKGGLPSTTLVYKHLQFLISLCKDVSQRDLKEYLRDVQACYTHLQDAADAKGLLPGIRDAKIWFNLDITQLDKILKQQLEASLTTAKLLCLNSPVDPLPIRTAKKFLNPYESLLSRLGCKSVIQPNVAAPRSNQNQNTPMADSLTEIRKLRDQRELIDVVFEVEGKEKVAHKIFLVAVSKYCKAQFLGHWGRQLERGATVTVEDVTFNTLSAMVDFAYTEEFVAPLLKDQTNNNEIADALDDMLDLLKGTDMWFLDRLHDVVEDFLLSPSISANWIRVDNVVEVKGHAHQAGAARLEKHCEDFILANKEIVEAVAASDDEWAGR